MKEMLRRRPIRMRSAVGRWSTPTACAAWIASPAILPLDARGGDCIDYGDYIHMVGSVDTPGSAQAWDVAVARAYAYIADDYLLDEILFRPSA